MKAFDLAIAAIGAGTMIFAVAPAAMADQVTPDDLIVQSSLCVGFDCVENENFGFDTVRLKENNLRIMFDDTSSSAGFPANDFAIEINDSANGGLNYFQIVDKTSNVVLMRLCAAADTNCEDILPAAITEHESRLDTQVADLNDEVAGLGQQVDVLGEQVAVNKDGVAMAIALGGGVPLMPEQRFTLGVNYGNFDGAGAVGVSGGARINNNMLVNGGLGYGFQTGAMGGRVGMQFAW